MNAAKPLFNTDEVREHLISSKHVAQTYRIRVWLPMRRADDSERFPVVYSTDSDDYFDGLTALAKHLHIHAETPRFILVGIGYEHPRAAPVLRMRDLLTHSIRKSFHSEVMQLAASPIIDHIDDPRVATETTDANDFLEFIHSELIPFINERYATVPVEDSYFGYSAGGAFGFHTLFTRPEVFKRYVLGSPATSCRGHHFGIETARAFIESGRSLSAKVFVSMGELEEFKRGFGQFELVSGYILMVKYLRAAAIPGLDLSTQIFPGETHSVAWSLAFTRGLRAVMGPVDQVPFWPDYLK